MFYITSNQNNVSRALMFIEKQHLLDIQQMQASDFWSKLDASLITVHTLGEVKQAVAKTFAHVRAATSSIDTLTFPWDQSVETLMRELHAKLADIEMEAIDECIFILPQMLVDQCARSAF